MAGAAERGQVSGAPPRARAPLAAPAAHFTRVTVAGGLEMGRLGEFSSDRRAAAEINESCALFFFFPLQGGAPHMERWDFPPPFVCLFSLRSRLPEKRGVYTLSRKAEPG